VISSGLSKWVKNRAITWCSGQCQEPKWGEDFNGADSSFEDGIRTEIMTF